MKKIGMRNVKTAIAVGLSIAIANLFNMNYPFYAAIAAIISMQSSLNESFLVGRNRIIGTVIGGFLGFIFVSIDPGSPILTSIGISILIYICNMFNLNKSISIAGIVFCAIMTNVPDKTPLLYSLSRTIDTTLGLVVAFLVNYFIAPPNSVEKLIDVFENTTLKTTCLLKDVLVEHDYKQLKLVSEKINSLEKTLGSYSKEIIVNKKNNVEIDKLKNVILICKKICFHLELITALEEKCFLNEENYTRINDMYRFENIEFKKLSDDDNIVFNYHIDKILNYIATLENVETEKIIQIDE